MMTQTIIGREAEIKQLKRLYANHTNVTRWVHFKQSGLLRKLN